jgi:rod shape-determining protein MreC
MKGRSEGVFRFAAPFRAALHRFAFIAVMGFCALLILVGRGDVAVVERARAFVTDLLSPVFSVLSRPASAISEASSDVHAYFQLREDHARLREEVRRLEGWQEVARRLDAENSSLRELLNFVPEPQARFNTGRVIADSGGAFVRNVLVSAGAEQGVAKGQVAMTGDGLVGRVSEVGAHSARVLLITDLNSHVPVVIEGGREHAVLAGDNTGMPRLIYVAQKAQIAVGDRVVTSGNGGVFPAGLPVGTIAAIGEHGIQVQPYADWGHLDYVRIIDYGLNDLLPAPTSPQPPRGVHK